MSTNYNQFRTDIFNQVAAVSSDPVWSTEFSDVIIDRAEQAIYRDLDLLGTRVTDNTGSVTANVRLNPLSTTFGTWVVVEQISIITPVTALSSNGSLNQLIRASPQFIDMTWPSASSNIGVPQYYANIDNINISLGPIPDQNYNWQIRGTQRPAPLTALNSSTILTQQLPDLFLAAGMVEAGAFMRFTEPTVFNTWLGEYQRLLKSAIVEEFRKKSMSEGWVDKLPSPTATPPRQ